MACLYFFSITKLSPIRNRSFGHACVERVLGDEVAPGGARLGICAAVAWSAAIISWCRGSLAGRRRFAARWGTGQVSFPGGDRIGEFLLALKDRADLERRVHGQVGPIAPRFVGLDLEALLLEEPGKGLECFGILAAGLDTPLPVGWAARTASG